MEPCRDGLPSKNYLREIRRITKKNNCILIFDEITSGWRLNSGGAHKVLGINPDMVVYGKTIANGIPMGVILGRKDIMNYTFQTFISSVFWTEKIGPTSAIAFIKKHKKLNLGKKLNIIGKKIKKIWRDSAKKNNLEIEIAGINPLASFKIKCNNWPQVLTYFIQEMLTYNILATNQCYANFKHKKKELKLYERACNRIFKDISILLKEDKLSEKLNGPVKEMGFNRLTNIKN